MRYIEVTHTYVIPVPADDLDVVEPLAREGMSIMEGFMSARARNLIDLRSDWKLMPKEYRPQQPEQDLIEQEEELSEELQGEITFHEGTVPKVFTDTPRDRDRILSKQIIEADADQGISFTGDIMGQRPKITHPWEQGIRITPPGHPGFWAETIAIAEEGLLCGSEEDGEICVGVKGHPEDHMWAPKEDYERYRSYASGTAEGDPGSIEAGPDGD